MIRRLAVTAALALSLSPVKPPKHYECPRLTLQGVNVISIDPIPCPMLEDDLAWNCATMGNRVCGNVTNPVYWPIRH